MSIQRPLLLVLCLAAGGCFVPSVAVTPRASFAELDGDIAASTSGGGGQASGSTSFEDLGLDGTDTAFSPRVDLDWLGFRVSLSTLNTSLEGSGTADATLEFDNVTIEPGDEVDSTFDLNTFSVAATWDFIPTDLVEVGLGLGFTLFDFDVAFDPEDPNLETASTEEAVPLPVIAARVGTQLGPFDLGAVLGFIDVDVDDVDATFFDLDLHGAYRLLGEGDRFVGHLVAGYRVIDLDATYDDGDSSIDTDFRISGPYVGAMFSF